MKEKGIFITFEGCEACGKTTQINLLSEYLQKANRSVVVTREPGGTAIGEMVRHLLIESANADNMVPEAELLLFAASRAQLVREVICPSLEEGKIILCDRFLDSTTVYQGVARRLASESVRTINTFAVGELMPDLTIVIDVSADESLLRVQRRTTGKCDRMERESIDFYKKVREGYLCLVRQYPERFVLVDGLLEVKKISQRIWDIVGARFLLK
ncbi:MAG: dTMP kinase [Puniceicoccales bacterium]|jgi:dTMP kinase|nr:dTMP kinase [Puniceicoccales bacterium]